MKGLETSKERSRPRRTFFIALLAVAVSGWCLNAAFLSHTEGVRQLSPSSQARRTLALDKCLYAKTPAGPPSDFGSREFSDRFVQDTAPVVLKNAKIWTGNREGSEILEGDILLDRGIIQAVGEVPEGLLKNPSVLTVDVQGRWVTPGLVDLHSHIGVYSAPALNGAQDGNSHKSPILPWLRSIDGLNTHDDAYKLTVSGGVTTAQILPGSANSIGGQAFVIKLRDTAERSPTSKVLEPPYTLNGTHFDHSLTPRWRHMKHACGENPSRVYSQTRMDSVWGFREAYNEARLIKERQDEFCAKAEDGAWDSDSEEKFPENLQWESLVDVLRGKVKLSIHCYTSLDLDNIVRLSNEFQFPVASFHHAGETYLVPDLLKRTWGGVPTIALFASNFRKKWEAYRGSEFAARVLASHNIPVVLKSDHPVLNSRYLIYEAAQAHYYGLNTTLALASVTTTPAKAAGLDHRIGYLRAGYDADVVVWDSFPLALGATPVQVYIDGIPQLDASNALEKSNAAQEMFETPDFDREAVEAVEYEGLPPLEPRVVYKAGGSRVAFLNVKSVYSANGVMVVKDSDDSSLYTVLVKDGVIECVAVVCVRAEEMGDVAIVDLEGGSLAPGLTTFGSPLGLSEIRLEPSTNDGDVFDALTGSVPGILGGDEAVIRAIDGLQFAGRNTLLAYRGGVTTAVIAPRGSGFVQGLGVAFSTGSPHALALGAIVQEETAFHISLNHGMKPGVSTQISALRNLLFEDKYASGPITRVREGTIPLVVSVDNADIMASLVRLKKEYERKTGLGLRMTFTGALEAHLLAEEIGKAGISVVLSPIRPFPAQWESRRILAGPPLTNATALSTLLAHKVNVAFGVVDDYDARNTRFELAWAALNSPGMDGIADVIPLVTANLHSALGLESDVPGDLVAYKRGGLLDLESKAIAVVSARRRVVDLF